MRTRWFILPLALGLIGFALSCVDGNGGGDDDGPADDDDHDGATIPCWDNDGDGYEDAACGGQDCDDANSEVHPGAYDRCGDKVDNDCDGVVDNPDDDPVELDEFIFGVSSGLRYSSGDPSAELVELGMHWYRPNISWRAVMPTVPDPDLLITDVTQEMIDELIDEADWTGIDNSLKLVTAAGIKPIPVIGHGYTSAHSFIDGEPASPKRIGKEHYLAYMYLYVRATVERYDGDGYKDADGIVIKHWQIENELNQALLTAIWGWRSPVWLEALLSPWADWDFCTELLATLNRAVHESDPDAITTQNLHTDIHPDLSHMILQPSWVDAATLWRDHMDLIGFDAYPNYYVAEPVYGYVVGERVEALREASCGKPIIVMEIGYPTGPAEMGFSWDRQAQFIDDAFHSAYDAGVVGYMQFGLISSDSHSVEITPEDIANMQRIGPLFTEGEALPLFIWALLNLNYLNEHFLDVVKAVEGYWGVIGPGDVRKPGFYVLQDIADEVYGP